MKMDIEGSELYALQSAEKALKTLKHIEMEIHNDSANNKVESILYEFNKIYKNAETNNFKSIIKMHPVYFMKLELHNRFKTSIRILFSENKFNLDDYPKIGYFYKK